MARLELSDMIVGLGKELLVAQAKGEKEKLKFKVEAVELEVQVTVSTETTVDGMVKWNFGIFSEGEAKAGGTVSKEELQTIRLKLTPEQDRPPVNVARKVVKRPH